MQKSLVRKGLILGIIILFIGASVVPSISGSIKDDTKTFIEAHADYDDLVQQTIDGGYVVINWSEQDKLVASDGESGDRFAYQVSIDGDYAIVGAYYDDNNNGVEAGSAYVFEKHAAPDLDCDGVFDFSDVKPGAIVECAFTVENIGEPLSELDWEIESYPDWGTWTFTPPSGINLTPEDSPATVQVEIIAPDEFETEFIGEVKIVNSEDHSDYCVIPVLLITPVSQHSINSQLLQLLQNFIRHSQIFSDIFEINYCGIY